jgi:hypothetical protein
MDGVHDMGGMQGFGAVDPTDELRWSKADWRARMFAIELSYTQPGGANVDWLRHVLECMPPAVYLGSEYFDRWYWRDAGVLANADWVDIEELRTGKAANRPADAGEPLSPEAVPAILEQGVDSRRAAEGAPAFKPETGRVRGSILPSGRPGCPATRAVMPERSRPITGGTSCPTPTPAATNGPSRSTRSGSSPRISGMT